jgi:hypothetical protein
MGEHPPYIFRLDVQKTLRVASKSHQYSSYSTPNWEFHLTGHYRPTLVGKLLDSYKAKTAEFEDIKLVRLVDSAW